MCKENPPCACHFVYMVTGPTQAKISTIPCKGWPPRRKSRYWKEGLIFKE